MKRALWLSMPLVLMCLVACKAVPPPEGPKAPSPEPRRPASLAPIPDGRGGWYAALAPVAAQGEASNMGGTHVTLRMIERRPDMPRWIHLGGHGEVFEIHCDDRFIGHVRKAAVPWKVFDAGWGLGALPAYDGELLAIARVAAGDDLAVRLSRAAREGVTGEAIAGDVPELGRGFHCPTRAR